MGTPVVVASINYTIPAYGDTGWAQGTGNLSQFLIAIAANIASSPSFMQVVSVSATPTAMTSGKTYMVNSATLAITLNLPAPAANAWFMIKDSGGNAINNNITIHRNGSESIDGNAADLVIASSYAALTIFSDGTNWFTMGSVGT